MKTKSLFLKGVVVAIFGLIMSAQVQAATVLRVASNFPLEHSVSKAMKVFKKSVEEAPGSDLKVKLYPNLQLGGAEENVDQTRSGSIFGTLLSVAYMSRIVPEYEAVSLPFVVTSHQQAWDMIDGKVGDLLDSKLEQRGFKGLGYGELGFRNVTNNKHPITSLEDFKGLKIRLQPNRVHLDTFAALGANPVSMDISEVYQALQQGVLDGQENPYDSIATRRFDEVQKYITNSRHLFDYMVFIANKRIYDGLTDKEKSIVDAASKKAIEFQRKQSAEDADKWRQVLIDRGMEYSELDDGARAEMKKAVQPVIEKVRSRVGDELVDAVLNGAQDK